jgi:hypothetical protein
VTCDVKETLVIVSQMCGGCLRLISLLVQKILDQQLNALLSADERRSVLMIDSTKDGTDGG